MTQSALSKPSPAMLLADGPARHTNEREGSRPVLTVDSNSTQFSGFCASAALVPLFCA